MKTSELIQVRNELIRRTNALIDELEAGTPSSKYGFASMDTIGVSLKVCDVRAVLKEILDLRGT